MSHHAHARERRLEQGDRLRLRVVAAGCLGPAQPFCGDHESRDQNSEGPDDGTSDRCWRRVRKAMRSADGIGNQGLYGRFCKL